MAFDHSIIPPSSAARRKQCAASATMELLHGVESDDEEAKIGTASHELAAQMVIARSRANIGFPRPEDTIGKAASNGVTWDQASYDGAEMFADHVTEIMQRTKVFTPDVEKRVLIPRIHPESWGTPDCCVFDQRNMTLYIDDYKFGHRPVEVFENWQMIEYAVGKIDEILSRGISDWNIKVVISIIQPRAPHRDGPIRQWTVSGSDLRGYANIAHEFEHRALSDNPEACTGSECRDCSARHVCDTLQQAGGSIMDFVGKPIPVNIKGPDLALEITLLRRAQELLKGRLSGLEAQAEGVLQSGGSVPGYSLEQGYGRQKWTLSNTEIFAICDLMGIDIRKPADAITPKQALKLGVDESVIKFYSTTPKTSVKLVYNSTKAREVFNK